MDKPSQLDENTTAQMQDIFIKWLEIIGRQVTRGLDLPGRIDIANGSSEGIGSCDKE